MAKKRLEQIQNLITVFNSAIFVKFAIGELKTPVGCKYANGRNRHHSI